MDDLMSATRYALMMIRFAATPPMPCAPHTAAWRLMDGQLTAMNVRD
jgi:hypothetical protein